MRRRNRQAGQALYIAAASLVVLMGFLGLGIDMGMLRYEKRLEQTAADAAAIAGASNLTYGTYQTSALDAARSNGFGDTGTYCTSGCPNAGDVGYVTVTINNPPLSGPHQAGTTNAPDYVEAIVSAVQPTYFMKVFGVTSETVTARAVATNWSGAAGTGNGCIYTLGTPTKKLTANSAGVGASGSVILNAPQCGIVDNGNLVANGGVNLSVNASSIGVGGTYNGPSQENCSANPPIGVCPAPCTDGTTCGMPYSGDPFANKYPVPPIGGCASNGTCPAFNAPSGQTTTFSPNTYVGGGTINNNATAVFSPGVYVLDGGSYIINGGASVCAGGTITGTSPFTCTQDMAGDGVTFYLTNSASLTVNGTPTVQMYAPNSGTYEGLLFYQDPADSSTMTLSGNSTSFYQGSIYMPNPDATLNFGGNAGFNSLAKYTLIVVGQLYLNGNPDVNINADYSGLANGGGPLAGAISSAVLVE